MNYGTAKWKKKREHILRLDGYVDQIARMYGRTEPATIVHHIYPSKDYPQWAWCDWNLISVSRSTHERLENRMGAGLTKFGKEIQERFEPGVNWRANRKAPL